MSFDSPGFTEHFQTGLPQQLVKDEWFGRISKIIQGISDINTSVDHNPTSGALERQVMLLIHLIPGEEHRESILEKKDRLIEERISTEMKDNKQAEEMSKICIELVGDVVDNLDRFMGLVEDLIVGPL